MINDVMSQDKYAVVDSTRLDLKHFQNFQYGHFYNTEYHDKILPLSNQLLRFAATVQTLIFKNVEDINIKNINRQ